MHAISATYLTLADIHRRLLVKLNPSAIEASTSTSGKSGVSSNSSSNSNSQSFLGLKELGHFLLEGVLTYDPLQRMTCTDVLSHSFFDK